jgi:hypothetical protein
MQDISADGVVENGWVENHKIVMNRRISLAALERLGEREIYRLKDGMGCKIMSLLIYDHIGIRVPVVGAEDADLDPREAKASCED